MKQRYRVFRRGWGTFYCEDFITKKQQSLKTRDKNEANRLVAAKNETQDAARYFHALPQWTRNIVRQGFKFQPQASPRHRHHSDEFPFVATTNSF